VRCGGRPFVRGPLPPGGAAVAQERRGGAGHVAVLPASPPPPRRLWHGGGKASLYALILYKGGPLHTAVTLEFLGDWVLSPNSEP